MARRAVQKLRKASQPINSFIIDGRHAARSTQQDATFGEPQIITKLKAVAPAALSRIKTPGTPHDLVKR
jgi:hypothetical protein